jgi:glycosyltransferase involved in cell wall biosynthesis
MLDLVRGLPERGIEVHVALQSPGPLGELLNADGIPWTAIKTHRWIGSPRGAIRRLRNRLRDAQTATRIAGVAREKGAVLVHTNTLSSPVGALIARKAGLPHVWHMREAVDTEPGSVFTDGLEAARRFIDETTDRVFCVSDALAQETARYVDPGKIRRLHNGPLSATPSPLAERDGIDPKGEIRLLTVGVVGPRKGQEEAVRALALLRKRGFNARLFVAGDGRREVLSSLRARSEELGVADSVEWLGYVDPKPYYQSCHVSLVCGPRDPLPRVGIEALAQGIPTVAIRSGGLPEIVDHGETGWLYEGGSPENLADAVEQAVRMDPGARDSMRRKGHRRVFERFNMERYRDDAVALYREMGIAR